MSYSEYYIFVWCNITKYSQYNKPLFQHNLRRGQPHLLGVQRFPEGRVWNDSAWKSARYVLIRYQTHLIRLIVRLCQYFGTSCLYSLRILLWYAMKNSAGFTTLQTPWNWYNVYCTIPITYRFRNQQSSWSTQPTPRAVRHVTFSRRVRRVVLGRFFATLIRGCHNRQRKKKYFVVVFDFYLLIILGTLLQIGIINGGCWYKYLSISMKLFLVRNT